MNELCKRLIYNTEDVTGEVFKSHALHFLSALLHSPMPRTRPLLTTAVCVLSRSTRTHIVYNLSVERLLSDASFLRKTVVITTFAQPLGRDGFKRSKRKTPQRLMARNRQERNLRRNSNLVYLNSRNILPRVAVQKQVRLLHFPVHKKVVCRKAEPAHVPRVCPCLIT